MKMWEKNHKLHKDNNGSGIVAVMVTIAFLGLLAAMLMFVTFGGYKMKLVDKRNKDTFYTVESVLDVVNVKLQQSVSVAADVAYQDVMSKFSIYETPAKRNELFYRNYYEKLKTELADTPGSSKGDISKLREFVNITAPELKGDGDLTPSGFNSYGAIIEGNADSNHYDISIDMAQGEELVLKGLKVSYVNEIGDVGMIETDIRIALPRMNFADSGDLPRLNDYVIISDGYCNVENVRTGSVNIKGSLCANQFKAWINPENPELGIKPLITFAPSSELEPKENGKLVLRKGLEVDDGGSLITKNMDIWATNITVKDSKADLDGNVYLENDLELKGKGSVVKLSGSYFGYGSSTTNADKSSAILINGPQSELDLSNLQNMNICGRSYIGTKYKDGDKFSQELENAGKDTEKKNLNDLQMGESIAVKSNQLAYLVPPEAIGCTIDGNSTINSNPMSYEDYYRIKNNPDLYDLFNSDKPIASLGGKALKEYVGTNSAKVIFKTSIGDPVVYLFLDFKNPESANQYFRDYYANNKQILDRYTKLYTKDIKIKNPDEFVQLTLGANAMAYSAGSGSLISERGETRSKNLSEILPDRHMALTTKLISSVAQLNGYEVGKTVFQNVINEDAIIAMKEPQLVLKKPSITAEGTMEEVIITKLPFTVDSGTKAKLIISTQDVTVKSSYKGLILTKGNVIITGTEGDVKLEKLSLEEFVNLVDAKDNEIEDKPAKYYAFEFFRDGTSYDNIENVTNKKMDQGTENISVSDLIVFENWSKR